MAENKSKQKGYKLPANHYSENFYNAWYNGKDYKFYSPDGTSIPYSELKDNTTIWVDSTGRPIDKKELDNYDLTGGNFLDYKKNNPAFVDTQYESYLNSKNRLTPEQRYRIHDQAAMSNPANPYKAALGWIGTNAALGTAAFGATAAAPFLAPGTTGGTILGHTAGSMALGMGLEQGQRAITGKSAGDYISKFLSSRGVPQIVADAARPEYFLNPTGKYTGQAVNSIIKSAENFGKRFTPEGFRIGNYAYKPDLSTMNSGVPLNFTKNPIETPDWKLEGLPGIQIKSLTKGSPLERQLSKNGTVSVKQLQAYIGRNDVPAHDKYLIQQVLNSHAGETHLDYNTLRREVQGMIPVYNRKQQYQYEAYGMDRIGFPIETDPAAPIYSYSPGTETYTYTFESPGIRGNTKHYEGNPVGHSRTYTTAEDPSVLHVMESQSDWAQNFGKNRTQIPDDRAEWQEVVRRYRNNEELAPGMPPTEENLRRAGRELRVLDSEVSDILQPNQNNLLANYMAKTYTQRQIQENLRYAAENGQTKMRYPTSETAAKIEGYLKSRANPEYLDLIRERDALVIHDKSLPDEINMETGEQIFYTPEQRRKLELELTSQIKNFESSGKHMQYQPEHQTILKKYADFKKQYEKLFGKGTVKEVTDSKGNTWYEVDVPQPYLDGTAEMIFRKGGNLNAIQRFKKRKNLIFK